MTETTVEEISRSGRREFFVNMKTDRDEVVDKMVPVSISWTETARVDDW